MKGVLSQIEWGACKFTHPMGRNRGFAEGDDVARWQNVLQCFARQQLLFRRVQADHQAIAFRGDAFDANASLIQPLVDIETVR
ncbi:hypothetical protein D3C80_1966940 [compost metagenome]